MSVYRTIGPLVYFLLHTDFYRNKLGSEDGIKIKNKIHSNHFQIELKSKETGF